MFRPPSIPSEPALERDPPAEAVAGIEWPTVAVAVLVYGLFGLVTWFHEVLPWWLLVPAGGYLVALHGSLQHEVVHGHPTRWRPLNEALVFPSLWLWMPYGLYRDSHLRHHDDRVLTDPTDDPESFYLTAGAWARLPAPARWLMVANNTALGRLILGPPVAVVRFVAAELVDPAWTRRRAAAWGVHAAGAGAVLAWVWGACGMPPAEYVAAFAYPGVALTLLRSFAEHRADPDPARRTAIVEAEAPLALVFLNNNLHVVHHARPGVPWYRLPALYRRRRADYVAAAGGDARRGYRAVVAEHLVRPREPVVHPAQAG